MFSTLLSNRQYFLIRGMLKQSSFRKGRYAYAMKARLPYEIRWRQTGLLLREGFSEYKSYCDISAIKH